MTRFIHKASKKAGLAPGTLVHIGDRPEEKVKVRMIDYAPEQFTEKEFAILILKAYKQITGDALEKKQRELIFNYC